MREEKLSSSFHGNPHFEVYEGMSDFYWFPYKSGPRRSRTDRYTPESPLIDPGDIQRVGEIITATFLHHNLRVRGKPGDDIVFVGESGGGAYGFKKDQRKGEGNPFWKLDSWKSVRELLLITPGKQQDGVILEFWEKDDRDNYYELQAGLACKGISMLELFERLGS